MRTCPECGHSMKEVAKLKGGYNRRKVHRFKCTNETCGLEMSTSQTEEEEIRAQEAIRAAEERNRKQNNYGNQD